LAVKSVVACGNSFDIHYDIVNPSGSCDLVFLHGWGSNKEVMKSAFAKLFPSFRHIYIDMPGFGKSPNKLALATAEYALILSVFLDEIGSDRYAIFGHSFGGKVATLLAPKTLMLLSSAGIPQPKPFKVRAKIAIFKALKPLGFSSLYKLFATKDAKGMPKNMYETLKNVVDEDFSQKFADFKGDTYIFWGKEDAATPIIAGETIHSLIPQSEFHTFDGDHYFFLKNAKKIEAQLWLNLQKL
jgi:pimeloyl-ACP methyl ester carboxylesterase